MKEQAIVAVEIGNAEWIDRAELLAVKWLRKRFGEFFTTDSLWRAVSAAGMPREPRAMGALVQRLQKRGLIMATAQFKESRRQSCHSRPVRVWMAT